ncbi:MAG: hypothetical protein R3C04_12010 [Hyphomonas sp.]
MTDVVRRTGEERRASIEENAEALGIDEAFISTLVDTFYGKVRGDAPIGPVFEGAIGESWDAHLPKMKSLVVHGARHEDL